MKDDQAASISRRLGVAVILLLAAVAAGVLDLPETCSLGCWILLGCVLVAAGLSGWTALELWGKTVAPRRESDSAKAQAEQLEASVRARAAELTMANQALKDENLERRWANQALEHQLRYAQAIIDSLVDPVLIVSKALNITRLNPAVLRATGYEASALVGGPVAKILPLDAAAGNSWANVLQAGQRCEDLSVILLVAKGAHCPARASVIPLVDGDRVVASVVILRVEAGPAACP